jgi:hypothetical protein
MAKHLLSEHLEKQHGCHLARSSSLWRVVLGHGEVLAGSVFRFSAAGFAPLTGLDLGFVRSAH